MSKPIRISIIVAITVVALDKGFTARTRSAAPLATALGTHLGFTARTRSANV